MMVPFDDDADGEHHLTHQLNFTDGSHHFPEGADILPLPAVPLSLFIGRKLITITFQRGAQQKTTGMRVRALDMRVQVRLSLNVVESIVVVGRRILESKEKCPSMKTFAW